MNNTIITNSTIDFINRDANSYYNPSCMTEIQRIVSDCNNLKLKVYEVMNYKFEIVIIIIAILLLYQFIINSYQPKFSQGEKYRKYIHNKIDFAVILLILSYIYYIFFL